MPRGIFKRTEEQKAKLRLARKGCVPWNKGIAQSEETKEKIRQFNLGKKHSDETKEKIRNLNIGEKNPMFGKLGKNHPKWIKDRTKLKIGKIKSYNTQYKYWMLEIKRRDNWKCRIQNQDCRGHLEAHHILPWRDYPELRYEINNGITLCVFHHPRKRSEEKRLSPYFQKLVANTK